MHTKCGCCLLYRVEEVTKIGGRWGLAAWDVAWLTPCRAKYGRSRSISAYSGPEKKQGLSRNPRSTSTSTEFFLS